MAWALKNKTKQNQTKPSAWGCGTGFTSWLQVSAERGRSSKSNRNMWIRTPGQMKDHFKSYSFFFKFAGLKCQNPLVQCSTFTLQMTSVCHHVHWVRFCPDPPRSATDSGAASLATDLSTAVSVLVSTAVVAVGRGKAGSPTQDPSWHAEPLALCLARFQGKAVGFPSARIGSVDAPAPRERFSKKVSI